jgi:hypothetical protein
MNVELWYHDTGRGPIRTRREICPWVPLSTKIPYLLAWSRTQVSAGTFRPTRLVGNPTWIRKNLTTRQHPETSALAYRHCRCTRSGPYRNCWHRTIVRNARYCKYVLLNVCHKITEESVCLLRIWKNLTSSANKSAAASAKSTELSDYNRTDLPNSSRNKHHRQCKVFPIKGQRTGPDADDLVWGKRMELPKNYWPGF